MALSKWQENIKALYHPDGVEYQSGRNDVTIVAYHFWDDIRYDEMWLDLEFAIREAWRHCGRLKTVVVTNAVGKSLKAFAENYPIVSIQCEPNLVAGNIFSMSADCNGRLASRFDTEYVLIVQNDGYPLRKGLDDFVGKFDFIGAPYVRNKLCPQIYCHIFKTWVMNGGFSLRSRNLCEFAAYHWNKTYSSIGDCRAASEDIFYTQTLPKKEPSFRRQFNLPTTQEALSFSWDALVPIQIPNKLPFGFHSLSSLDIIAENFKEQLK